LLIIYTCCLILQFKIHSTLLAQGSDDTETAQSKGINQDVETTGLHQLKVKLLIFFPMQLRRDLLAKASGHSPAKQANLTAGACLLMFVASTTLVSLCAGFLVDTIDPLVVATKMFKVFVGLILIPIIGNVAKYHLAVLTAYKDKHALVIEVTDSSSEPAREVDGVLREQCLSPCSEVEPSFLELTCCCCCCCCRYSHPWLHLVSSPFVVTLVLF